MTDTRIDWTDKVWNPTTGCTLGCSYCYAEPMADRLRRMGQAKYSAGFAPVCHPGELEKPLHWKKPVRVFVNSMGDLFDAGIPFDFIDQVMAVIALCPQHTFQILTKQPRRMREYFTTDPASHCTRVGAIQHYMDVRYARSVSDEQFGKAHRIIIGRDTSWPLSNLWLGVTVTGQADANTRIPYLIVTPAAKRFLSVEPMINMVDLENINGRSDGWGVFIDWVICGGETGKNARPLHPDWVRSLRDQCLAADVPFFFKQWGEWLPTASANYATRENGWRYGKAIGISMLRDGRQVYLDNGPDKIFQTLDMTARRDLERAMKKNIPDQADPDKYDWLGYQWLHCVGKKAAGHLLDGKEWRQFPC